MVHEEDEKRFYFLEDFTIHPLNGSKMIHNSPSFYYKTCIFCHQIFSGNSGTLRFSKLEEENWLKPCKCRRTLLRLDVQVMKVSTILYFYFFLVFFICQPTCFISLEKEKMRLFSRRQQRRRSSWYPMAIVCGRSSKAPSPPKREEWHHSDEYHMSFSRNAHVTTPHIFLPIMN